MVCLMESDPQSRIGVPCCFPVKSCQNWGNQLKKTPQIGLHLGDVILQQRGVFP